MFASADTVPDLRFPQPRPYPVLAKPCTGPEQFLWSVRVAEVSRAREREREWNRARQAPALLKHGRVSATMRTISSQQSQPGENNQYRRFHWQTESPRSCNWITWSQILTEVCGLAVVSNTNATVSSSYHLTSEEWSFITWTIITVLISQ